MDVFRLIAGLPKIAQIGVLALDGRIVWRFGRCMFRIAARDRRRTLIDKVVASWINSYLSVELNLIISKNINPWSADMYVNNQGKQFGMNWVSINDNQLNQSFCRLIDLKIYKLWIDYVFLNDPDNINHGTQCLLLRHSVLLIKVEKWEYVGRWQYVNAGLRYANDS